MIKKFFFILICFLNLTFSYAETEFFCSNKNTYEIDNYKPELIEIKIHNYRKWQINNLRMVQDIAEKGRYSVIPSKYKKRFKATVSVVFDNKMKCSFKASVRQHGDFADHIEFVDGNLLQSLSINLRTGHINGITKFILLVPNSRKNPEEEIILTELLRKFGFITPRTSFVKVNHNNLNLNMLFQEKAEKELLEYHLRREGPIFEGDERYRYSINDRAIRAQLARQTNAKWSERSTQHQIISHESLTSLNKFYLLTKNDFSESKFNHILYNINLDNEILASNNPKQSIKLDIYNAVLWGANGYHGLIPHNRKFYWNTIDNYFEPIYYDGDLTINHGYSKPSHVEFVNFSNKENLLAGLKEARKKINQIKIEDFFELLKFRGSKLSKNEVSKKLNQISNNLTDFEKWLNDNKMEAQNAEKTINNKVLSNYINSTVETKKKIYLVFKDPKVKNFKVCENTTLLCKEIKLTENEIVDLLRGRLIIGDNDYQYIGEYIISKDKLEISELEVKKPLKYEKFNIKNTTFYYSEHITFKYNEDISTLDIYQSAPGARAFFNKGTLKDININFHGYDSKITSEIPNFPIDKRGLTGCLSFIHLNLKNITIKSNKSTCEDAVNLINVQGSINKIDIENSYSDGLDVDFSNVEINNIHVASSKNDCVDLSAGNYKLNKLNLTNCGDKALSVGEKSILMLNEITIKDSNIGIASKDSSISKLNNAYLNNMKTCVSAYNKKQEFFGSLIEIKNIKCKDYLVKIDTDVNSKIIIENEL